MKKLIIKWLLGDQLDQLWHYRMLHDKTIAEHGDAIENLRYEDIKNDYNRLAQILKALLDYLKVDLKKTMEIDPTFPPPEPKMIEVFKIIHLNDSNKRTKK